MCAERERLVHCRTSSTPPPPNTHTHSSLAGSGHRGVGSEGLVQQLRVGVTVVVHQHPSAVHVALDLVHQQHAAVVVHVVQQLQHGRRHVLRPAANAKGGTGSGGLHTEHCNYNLGREALLHAVFILNTTATWVAGAMFYVHNTFYGSLAK